MDATKQSKINQTIQELSKDRDIMELVSKIEGGIKTTKGNYGRYMAFLSSYKDNKIMLYVISEALKLAGADCYGVDWALKLI